jgi:hypothetical protein
VTGVPVVLATVAAGGLPAAVPLVRRGHRGVFPVVLPVRMHGLFVLLP